MKKYDLENDSDYSRSPQSKEDVYTAPPELKKYLDALVKKGKKATKAQDPMDSENPDVYTPGPEVEEAVRKAKESALKNMMKGRSLPPVKQEDFDMMGEGVLKPEYSSDEDQYSSSPDIEQAIEEFRKSSEKNRQKMHDLPPSRPVEMDEPMYQEKGIDEGRSPSSQQYDLLQKYLFGGLNKTLKK